MSNGKKKNFTTQERHLLLELLKSYKHIIDNKKTDNVSANLKKQAWAEIADTYNTSAIISEKATGDQLRRLWFNLKTRHREAIAKVRHRMTSGDGGPCFDADIDPNVAEVAAAVLVEMANVVDSDYLDNLSEPICSIIEAQPSPKPSSTEQPLTPTEQPSTCSDLPSTSAVLPTTSDVLTSTPAVLPSSCRPAVYPSMTVSPLSRTTFIQDYSSNEKKIRMRILKQEHFNKERRAEELHAIEKKYLEEKHAIELQILKHKLKEAETRAELAQKELCNK